MKINVFPIALLGAYLAIPAQAQQWQTLARYHRLLKKTVPGTLALDDGGVEFRSARFNQRWPWAEIRSFDLSQHELTLLSYERRQWHEPGERPFHFTLSESLPPEVAAQIAARVGKPARNGDPLPAAAAVAEIPAHRRGWAGGSNGTLRLKDDGIDYVSDDGRDSRSWRWADIQTIANPNPYELRITAYREIAEFELKQPLPSQQFDRLWDRLYAADLNVSIAGGR